MTKDLNSATVCSEDENANKASHWQGRNNQYKSGYIQVCSKSKVPIW